MFSQSPTDKEISIIKKTINVGEVKKDSVINTDFYLKNISDKKINILHVERSCDCTAVKLTDSIINPNKTIKISLIVDTQWKKDDFEVTTVVVLNSKQKNYLLTVKGKVNKE